MSDSVVELKKTVKQLQSAVNEQVCLISYVNPVIFPVLINSSQEILSILNTLKPRHVTENILRVGVARPFFFYLFSYFGLAVPAY